MKIIFTVTNDLTYDQRMHRICQSLAGSGYDIWLVGRTLKNSQPFENQHFKSKKISLFFNKGKLFYIEYNIRLFFWLLFQKFDIVCGIDLDTILPCYFASKLRGGKPCVYDAHELFAEVPEVIRRPYIRRIWLWFEKYIVPKIKYRYTVSQSVANEFYRRYQTPFEVIRNLPYRQTQNPKRKTQNSKSVILYQGALNEGRGLEYAIEAMQYIENAALWLIGEGDLSAQLRGVVAKRQLEKKVKFLGFIKPNDLPKYTAQATIGLNLLEDKGMSYRYSLANKFLDYIQAELPQICIQFIEYQRLNEQYNIAVLIEKADIKTLIEVINRLLNDDNLLFELKENCRKAAIDLCWENEEKKLIAFYNAIIPAKSL
jgi:glycosyltransferase involved in cell wall biosynthesis